MSIKTRTIQNVDLLDNTHASLVGDMGGVAVITGDVERSSARPGFILVETEFGSLYLDEDGESLVPMT